MIETLYINGCSWMDGYLLQEETQVIDYAKTMGYEIEGLWNIKHNGKNVSHYSFKEIYNKFNFASHLANELNITDIYNDAAGAGSNSRIVRKTVEYVKKLTPEQKEKTLVVIGWTMPERNEMFLEDKTGTANWHKFNLTQRFSELDPSNLREDFVKRIDKFWEQYVVDVHSFYQSIKKFFEQSYLLANLLENNNIKYYFFNTFPVLWGYQKIHSNCDWMSEFKKEIEFYNKNISALDMNITFREFIEHVPNCHLSDNHPNVLGNKIWANYIIQDMKNKKIII